jgi:hypothetical protein
VVFARWWFNRWLPGRDGPTLDRTQSVARESVNVWHAMETSLGADGARLAAGDLRSRLGGMAYQPTVMPDGSIVGVFAANLGLTPGPGAVGIHRLPRAGGPSERIAGALIDPGTGSYEDARGLAAPAACAPTALPDGRLLFSWSPGGRGDFGLYVTRPGAGTPPVRVVDLAGTLELDAAPIVRRPAGPSADPWFEGYSAMPPRARPRPAPPRWEDRDSLAAAFVDSLVRRDGVSWFRSADVFGGAPGDSSLPAPPQRVAGARIRF